MRSDGLAPAANAMGLEERSSQIARNFKRRLQALLAQGKKKSNGRKGSYVDTLHVQRIALNDL
jgi:hypothetical protein